MPRSPDREHREAATLVLRDPNASLDDKKAALRLLRERRERPEPVTHRNPAATGVLLIAASFAVGFFVHWLGVLMFALGVGFVIDAYRREKHGSGESG
jgi:hypothetical protein